MIVYELNAFAQQLPGGNPAGVVLNAEGLTEKQMMAIAEHLGHSETAFVTTSEKADFRVRFFTPVEEVDLCGHATIAAFSALFRDGVVQPGQYKQETLAGILDVWIEGDGSILMAQKLPEFYPVSQIPEIAASLNLKTSDLHGTLPVQVVSTGLKDILIPVKNAEILNAIVPDFAAIEQISQRNDVVGYHVFAMDSPYGGTAIARNFAPLYGIPEESATGTSNGALGCYLYHHGVLGGSQGTRMTVDQGHSMGSPSIISVLLNGEATTIEWVRVGGSAVFKRVVELPASLLVDAKES